MGLTLNSQTVAVDLKTGRYTREGLQSLLSLVTRTGGATGVVYASGITFTPTGNISSTNVQTAIAEVDSEKQPKDATLTALSALVTAANKIPYATDVDTFSTLDLDTDGTLAANSDTRIATQKAVKTYADALIAATDAMVFKGIIDCSASPNYPAANRGDTYRVSVAGKIGGASGVVVEVGDILICLTDGTPSGDQATVGADWTVIQTNIDGAVVGPTSSVSGNIATFSGTTGKVIQDGGKALPSGNIVGTSDTQTLTNKTLTSPVINTPTGTMTLSSGVLGYSTGNGGTVTQSTDKATGVTLDKICGQITTNNQSVAAGASASFTLTNSQIAASDAVILNHVSGGTFGAYHLDAQPSAGSAIICIRNLTAGSLGEAIVIRFSVIKGATA